jgi:hypothetical protein
MAAFDIVGQGDGDSEALQHALVQIIRDNVNTQYASQAVSLAEFRDAVSTHGGPEVDATLLADFRSHVPLSEYDSYKPFVDKFNVQPCKEEDVTNMFSPGLPDFLASSGATSGTTPKIWPKYNHHAISKITMGRSMFDPSNKDPLAAVVCTKHRDVKVIERASGEVVERIPVCILTGGMVRRGLGWYTDDESRMSLISTSFFSLLSPTTHTNGMRVPVPGYIVPWAATVIGYFPSFLIIHGLFFLAHRDVHRFRIPFATLFVDLIRHINEHWDMLVSCIRDGRLPDLEGIDHVREYLQASQRSINLNVVTEALRRLTSMPIPSAHQNCLRSGPHSPLKDGLPAFGQKRTSS